MRRLCFLVLLTLCLILLIACGDNQDKTYITFGEAGLLTAQVETTQAGSIRVPSPAGINADSCVGWQAKTEGGNIFLLVGATYTYEAGENKSFSPVYLDLETHEAALVLDGADTGICFTTKIMNKEWEKLATLAPDVTHGTLIFTASDMSATGGTLTHAALQQAGKEPVDIPADGMFVNVAEQTCFTSTLTAISDVLGSKSYTAVGYVKITCIDGSVRYVYANSKTCSASAVLLARAALSDLSDTQDGTYQYAAGDKFSPYNNEEQAKLAELSKFSVLLVSDATVRGNRRLHDDYFTLYTSHMIVFRDDSNASQNVEYSEEAQAIYRALGQALGTEARYYAGGGALIIDVKDSTELSAENVGSILIDYGVSVIEVSIYFFYNGSLVVPYKVYTRPY
ncbi:MAG: hypothetical protein IKA46_04705 [Clostridia bacterium]|nr:hypothetical protein [Clostridia bacterium]MBR2464297.1 hypothetical protein [Clostridia bacterium]MBR3862215.1 hypothetical protein [Clostridia bacterium]